MGSYVEMHADKRRGTMDISDIGKEAVIHWNGPPIAKADSIGEAAMNRIFKGGRFFGNSNFSLLFIIYRWNFVTMANKTDSVVTKRHREEEPAFPFFS